MHLLTETDTPYAAGFIIHFHFYTYFTKMTTQLAQLKSFTTVVADTGDFECECRVPRPRLPLPPPPAAPSAGRRC